MQGAGLIEHKMIRNCFMRKTNSASTGGERAADSYGTFVKLLGKILGAGSSGGPSTAAPTESVFIGSGRRQWCDERPFVRSEFVWGRSAAIKPASLDPGEDVEGKSDGNETQVADPLIELQAQRRILGSLKS